MAVDWAQALQIGGIGFLLVFTVLVILALVTRLISLLVDRIGSGKGETANSDKE